MKKILIFTILAALAGCSSRWNEKTCVETNFSDLGYQEGSAGKSSKLSYYNQACLKKNVQIPAADYDQGYTRGLAVYCSKNRGFADGSAGKEMFTNCRGVKAYTLAHRNGLKNYCSTEKGVQDGFSMAPEYILCTSFSAYTVGYANGKKEFCSHDRGHEHGFKGTNADARCISYSAYKSGFEKGQKYFCSPENGTRIGERGDGFPEKCNGLVFRRNYNKGRLKFLTKVLRDKETAVSFERQNYERVRDELQDMQFALNRLPKYSTDPAVEEERARINSEIEDLQDKRNGQRDQVEKLQNQVNNIKNEMRDLKGS